MKVLIAHNSYLWYGGEDFVVEQESALLRSQGHEVLLYRTDNKDAGSRHKIDLACSSVWNQHSYDDITRLVSEHHVDLVHIHNYFPLLSPSIFVAARRAGAAVVHTVHNYRQNCLNGLFFRSGKVCHDCADAGHFLPGLAHSCYRNDFQASAVAATTIGVHRLLRTIAGCTDRIIALSDFQARMLAQAGFEPSRIKVKANFLFDDPGMGQGPREGATFAGRLSEEKGIRTIVEAWKTIDMPLSIAGDGPLRRETDRAVGTIDQAQTFGFLAQTELIALLKRSQLFLLPGLCLEAGHPIALLQALACGTPVAVSNRYVDVDRLVQNGVAAPFEVGDPQQLSQTVRELRASGRLSEMGKQARNLFEREHTAPTNYRQLIRIYEEALTLRRQHQDGWVN